jgi:predicted Zn-dependent protease
VEAVRSLAEVAAREGQFDEADRMYGRAVQLAPEDKQSYLSLAKYQLSRGQLADASHSIDSALVPDEAEPFIIKAQILLGLEKVPEAAAALEQAAAAAPSEAGIQGNLGSLYLKLGRVDDGEKRLQEAVRLDPNFSDAYAALAEIWQNRDPSVARMYRSHVRR